MGKQLPVLTSSPLPPLYAAWMDQLLAGPIPREADATCDDCAMLPAAGEEATPVDLFFNPETKCCSYIPDIANFLVGRILSDDDPAFASGRMTIEDRLRSGVNVTPLGLGQPPNFKVLYGISPSSLFGQSRTLRCPHYLAAEGGRCGIWKHRASVCATWHCKYVRGTVGLEFWTTLHQLLSAVEKSLSRWCLLKLNPGAAAIRLLFPPSAPGNRIEPVDAGALDGYGDPQMNRRLWGSWSGREREFYIQCAQLVNALSWEEVIAIGGPDLQILAQMLGDTYANLISETIPEHVRPGAMQVIAVEGDFFRITTYNAYDPLSVPRQLIEALRFFDGRPTTAALAAIAAADGVILEPALVQKLTDFGVLVPDGAA